MAAIELMGLKHIIVLQNKIDLIHENSAKSNYMDIRKFIQGTPAGNRLCSASLSNKTFEIPHQSSLFPRKWSIILMFSAIIYATSFLSHSETSLNSRRWSSFDHSMSTTQVPRYDSCSTIKNVNRNFQVHELKGGVCGGSLMRGVLVLSQEIEIRPGVTVRDDANNSQVFPTKSKIMSLKSDKNDLQVILARFSWDKTL